MKQFQNRSGRRRPHGDPAGTTRISIRVSDELRSAFLKAGGSEWARGVLKRALRNKGE